MVGELSQILFESPYQISLSMTQKVLAANKLKTLLQEAHWQWLEKCCYIGWQLARGDKSYKKKKKL